MVGSQTANLTPNLSFDHNLCFKSLNGWCKPISDIYVLKNFQWYEEHLNPMSFDPCNHPLKIWKSIVISTPRVKVHLRMWGFILSHSLAFAMSQPHFGQVWGWSPTLGKVEGLESSGTPECSELNNKAQNTLHWGVLGVIEKVLKRRYRKWPCIDNLVICSPSYGQKKGRESNWQFDSRPLKVQNRPLPDVTLESATWRWKALNESYNFDLELGQSEFGARSYGRSKFQESSQDTFRTPFQESQQNVAFGCSLRDQPQRILYGGRWWLPPSPGHGESCVSKCLWQIPTPKGVPNAKLTRFGWFLDTDSHELS
jgi:hypothetical protein